MSNILTQSFTSNLAVDQILDALRSRVPNQDAWRIQDSEYDGRYIRGTFESVKVRIIQYTGYYESELWFGNETGDEQDATTRRWIELLEQAVGIIQR